MITNNQSWSLGSCSNKSFEPAFRLETPVRPLLPGDHSFPTPQSNCVHSRSPFPAQNQNASRTLRTDKKRLKRINTDKKRLTLSATYSTATPERIKRIFRKKFTSLYRFFLFSCALCVESERGQPCPQRCVHLQRYPTPRFHIRVNSCSFVVARSFPSTAINTIQHPAPCRFFSPKHPSIDNQQHAPQKITSTLTPLELSTLNSQLSTSTASASSDLFNLFNSF